MTAPVLTALGVIVKLPVDAPVNEPVPNVIASALSSQPMNTLSELPLSITKPASFEGEPDVPFLVLTMYLKLLISRRYGCCCSVNC